MNKATLLLAVLAGALSYGCSSTRHDSGGTTPRDSSPLAERGLHCRAVEAVIWGMPAVNFDLMLQAAIKAGAAPNQIVYWSRPLDWKDQTLTPNPDTIYFMPFYDTKDGPVVMEIPPADGSIDVHFGPAAPSGKESNWVPTKAGGQFEVLFRFYGPTKALFDKTWMLPDIEKTK